MTDPNLDLLIQKLTPPGQSSLEIEYPGVTNPTDIFDDNGNLLFPAGDQIGAVTVNPENDIRDGNSIVIKYSTVPIVVTNDGVFTISEPQNLIVITSGTSVILPSAVEGIRITIKSISGAVNISGGTVDGVAGATLAGQYDFMELVSDGAVWYKVASS